MVFLIGQLDLNHTNCPSFIEKVQLGHGRGSVALLTRIYLYDVQCTQNYVGGQFDIFKNCSATKLMVKNCFFFKIIETFETKREFHYVLDKNLDSVSIKYKRLRLRTYFFPIFAHFLRPYLHLLSLCSELRQNLHTYVIDDVDHDKNKIKLHTRIQS